MQFVTATVLVATMLIGYGWFTESQAKARAREFCEGIRVGEPAAPLLERAYAAGADQEQTHWFRAETDEAELSVTFTGATPFSRHICSIRGADFVKESRYAYLD
ncbi:hypothetical protein [Ideonella sp.]|uniref:hypothetical protein n=1 Tax=Ideonella sp. TaxID=1929293 RepID=UPI0037C01EB5